MRRLSLFVILILAVGGMVVAHAVQGWTFSYHPFQGRYAIYGGGLGDPLAPSSKDKRIAFWIDGKVARQMFDAMGPDLRNVCGAEGGQRIRQRAQLSCSYHPRDGYRCNFGFDLVTGLSIGGSLC